jgi:(p)ppGpp synthase/HD superfamily hydrolase
MTSSYSSRFNAALGMAARAHVGQERKGKKVPYVTHPVHVAAILERHGFREELVLAGLLHDTLEDTSLAESELRRAMGDEVLALVVAVTEIKRDGAAERSWETRKAEQLAHLAEAGPDVAALKAADALHNVAETLEDVRALGAETVFRRFKRGPEPSIGYYRSIARLAGERLGQAHPLVVELRATIEDLARAAGVAG